MSDDNRKEWYSNKELFESITELKNDLTETKHIIKHYNGLYEQTKENNDDIKLVKEKVSEVSKDVHIIKAEDTGKNKFIKVFTQLSGWVIALLALLLNFYL